MEIKTDDMRSAENGMGYCMNTDNEILTMAFVNYQPIAEIYELSKGYRHGTIFPDLDKPFLAGGMRK